MKLREYCCKNASLMRIIVLFTLVLTMPVFLNAYYSDMGGASRPRGMANAFVAEMDGLNSIHYNPAGTAFTKNIELMTFYNLSSLGVQNFDTLKMFIYNFGFMFPFTSAFRFEPLFKDLVMGFEYHNFNLSYDNSIYDEDDNLKYYERLITMNLAKGFRFSSGLKFSTGLNFDIYLNGMKPNSDTESNPALSGKKLSKVGFGMDLGFLFIIGEAFKIGAVWDNILEANMSWLGNKDRVLTNLKIGLSFDIKKLWFMEHVTVAAGVSYERWPKRKDIRKPKFQYRFAYEWWNFQKMLGIRFGYEFGKKKFNNLGLGISFNKDLRKGNNMEFDLSYNVPLFGHKGNRGDIQLTMFYRWKMPKSKFEFDEQRREELEMYEKMSTGMGGVSAEDAAGSVDSSRWAIAEPTADPKSDEEKTEDEKKAESSLMAANEEYNSTLDTLVADYSTRLDQLETPILDEKRNVESDIENINAEIKSLQKMYNKATTDEDKVNYGTQIKDKNKATIEKVNELNNKISEANTKGLGFRTELEKSVDKAYKSFIKVYNKNVKLVPWFNATPSTVDLEKQFGRAGVIEKLEVPGQLDIDIPAQLSPEQQEALNGLKTANENRNSQLSELADGYTTDVEMALAELKTEKGELETENIQVQKDIKAAKKEYERAGSDEDKIKFGTEVNNKSKEIIEKYNAYNSKVDSKNAEIEELKAGTEKQYTKIIKTYNKTAGKLLKIVGEYEEVPAITIEEIFTKTEKIEKLEVPEKAEVEIPEAAPAETEEEPEEEPEE